MERIRILAFIFGIFMLNNSIEASSFDGIKDRRPIMSAKSFKRKEPEVSFNFLAAVQTRLDFPTFAVLYLYTSLLNILNIHFTFVGNLHESHEDTFKVFKY